jgi:hypothetical protein
MNNRLIVLLLSAAVSSGVGVWAQAPRPTGQIDGAVPAAAGQPAPSASTTLRVNGTIDRFDASTRILSLSTSNGTAQFPVASTTRIRQGWHKVDPAELQKLAGNHATVRYTESGGIKIVESVHVFGKNQRIER